MLTGKPVERKDPVDSVALQVFEIDKGSFVTVLLVLRNHTMMLIGFAGFLRYDELCSLICENVTVESRYLERSLYNDLKRSASRGPNSMYKVSIALVWLGYF